MRAKGFNGAAFAHLVGETRYRWLDTLGNLGVMDGGVMRIKDPEAMFPGERRMVKYDFDDAQIADLIAFLEWIQGIETNGFPPKPDLALPAAPVVAKAEIAPAPPIFGTLCVACHAVGGKGGAVGPALDGVAHRKTPAELDRWLADPASVKPGTAMPKLPIDEPTRAALVAWLSTLN